MTLMGAQSLNLGGAPAGPAGRHSATCLPEVDTFQYVSDILNQANQWKVYHKIDQQEEYATAMYSNVVSQTSDWWKEWNQGQQVDNRLHARTNCFVIELGGLLRSVHLISLLRTAWVGHITQARARLKRPKTWQKLLPSSVLDKFKRGSSLFIIPPQLFGLIRKFREWINDNCFTIVFLIIPPHSEVRCLQLLTRDGPWC